MDAVEAKRAILRHAEGGPSETLDTLLTSLRPYRGIREEHFLEILNALLVVAPELNRREVDRQIVHALWDLCRTARAWTHGTCEPMFHGPRFIEPAEKKKLGQRIEIIESITLDLMRGEEVWSVFLRMPWYVLEYRFGAKAAFFSAVFAQALQHLLENETRLSVDDEVMLCEAFGAMGSKAKHVAALMRQVHSETAFEEVRAAAVKALEGIAEQ